MLVTLCYLLDAVNQENLKSHKKFKLWSLAPQHLLLLILMQKNC